MMDEFDLDEDAVGEINDAYRVTGRSVDRSICICGHAISRHQFDRYTGTNFCKPGQYSCPCVNKRAVLEVPNTRYFMRKSHGSGTMHALAMGYKASKDALGEDFVSAVEWLIPAVCDMCGTESKYFPVRTTLNGEPILDTDEDLGVSAFLCETCRTPE